jgi:hypothetical protein
MAYIRKKSLTPEEKQIQYESHQKWLKESNRQMNELNKAMEMIESLIESAKKGKFNITAISTTLHSLIQEIDKV